MLLENVRQVIMADDIVSSDATVDDAVLKGIGTLRDEVETDTAAFTDDAGVDGISPGDEEAIEVPVAIESCIYHDYYDIFGMFSPLYLY
jgi:hypothetical protein